MRKIRNWKKDYSRHPESEKGLQTIGETVIQMVLMLGALYSVYVFFEKTELESFRKSSEVEQGPSDSNH